MPDDFLTAIKAISVHQFTNEGACPLVLHSCLD